MPAIDITDAEKRIRGSFGTIGEILGIQHTPQASCLVQTKEGVVFRDTIYADNEGVRSPNQGDGIIIYGIGSLAKIVVSCALCILILESKGSEPEILLQDPISKHINQLSLPDSVTIQSLLLHISGLPSLTDLLLGPDGNVWTTYEKLLEAIQNLQDDGQISWPEGDNFKTEYSNAGFILAASLIEKRSKKPIGQFLKDRVFVPLRMGHTFITDGTSHDAVATPHVVTGDCPARPIPHKNYSENTVVFPAMGIYSCMEDLAKFFSALLSAYLKTPEAESPITADVAEMVLKGRVDYNSDHKLSGVSYGFGVCCTHLHTPAIGGNSLNRVISRELVGQYKMGNGSGYTPQKIYYHGGAITGYEGAFYLIPETEGFSFIIVLTNATGLGDASDLISRLMLEKFFDLQPEDDLLELSRACAKDRLRQIQSFRIESAPNIPLDLANTIVGTYIYSVFGQSINIFKRGDSLFATVSPFHTVHHQEKLIEFAVVLSDHEPPTFSLCTLSDEDFAKLGIDIYVSWGLEFKVKTEDSKISLERKSARNRVVVYQRL